MANLSRRGVAVMSSNIDSGTGDVVDAGVVSELSMTDRNSRSVLRPPGAGLEDDLAPSGGVVVGATSAANGDKASKTLGESGRGGNGSSSLSRPIEELYEEERESTRIRHWKESPYAVGLVEPTWRDELLRRPGARVGGPPEANGPNRPMMADAFSNEIDPTCGCLTFSGLVCSRLGAGRVGNMVVLRETTEFVEEQCGDDDVEASESAGAVRTRRVRKSRIDLVVGPYWPMLMFVTYPLIIGVSLWTALQIVPRKNLLLVAIWASLTAGLCYALFSTGFRDPGIMLRYTTPPADSEGGRSWRWNDQALSYRPYGAIYDPDCACIIEGFDHTCPWTGTAIGKRNMKAFQSFVFLVFTCLVMDILLLTGAI